MGSLALADNVTGRDAPLVANMRANGLVILGKTNLSEWANFRSQNSNSGWSAVGGQARNPYALDRSPCGSSSGSGVAVAAGYVDLAIGTAGRTLPMVVRKTIKSLTDDQISSIAEFVDEILVKENA